MDGWAVGRHARKLLPDISVIYVTADSVSVWPSEGVPGGMLFAKPFGLAQIITVV